MARDSRSVLAFKRTLCELLVSKSLDDIRTKDICELSTYSRTAFYANFYDKYELAKRVVDDEVCAIVDLATEVFDRFAQGEIGSQRECQLECGKTIFEHISSSRDTYSCIFDDRLMDSTIDYMVDALIEKLGKGFDYRFEDDSLGYVYEHFFLRSTYLQLFSLARLWASRDFDLKPEEIAAPYVTTIHWISFGGQRSHDGKRLLILGKKSGEEIAK